MKYHHSVIRPILILELLQRYTSKTYPMTCKEICDACVEYFDIEIDPHTVSRIIDELNIALYLSEQEKIRNSGLFFVSGNIMLSNDDSAQ